MKQIINRLIFTALAAVLLASGLSSCTSEPWGNPGLSSAISLSANVQATTHTKAAVSGTTFPAGTDNVFRLTAFAGAAAPSTDWSAAPYFNDIQVNSGAASALTLATAQYYPANGDKVYFYGYAPKATSLTAGGASAAPTANYTITGQEDIMAAQAVTGFTTAATTGMHLAFTHKLMQVRFKIVKDASFEAGKKVTEILVKDVKNSAKLNIATGVLTFDDTADNLSLPIVAGIKDEITEIGTEMDGCVMLEPVGTGGSITLKATADGVVYDNIKVTITGTNDGTAGTSHLITLTFKRGEITSSATITDWATPVDKDVDVDDEGLTSLPVVGDYYYSSDGSHSTDLDAKKTATGLIYWIDPADPQIYKVMALEQYGVELMWASSTSYAVSGAQSDTDGKANSAAIKTAFDAKMAGITINETDFAVAFPAAAYCYNYTGKENTDAQGSWHLPAKSELQYLWCSYNGKNPISWESGTSADASTNDIAQGSWNNRIKAGGGTVVITQNHLWSSTEYSGYTSAAWYVGFSNGSTSSSDKGSSNTVRCVRDITPPPPPAVGDYYYSDGSHSTDLIAGKTATGLIYYLDPADPKKYKVMALEEATSKLAWAANNSYVVSSARNDTDGKANSAAIKAAFDVKMAGIAITQDNFATAFPAAAYCYNYKGKVGTDTEGSWHLPAQSELQYLWCAYNGKTPSSGESAENGSIPKDADAQGLWNGRITAGGGTAAGITGNYFWSSTEVSTNGNRARVVTFLNGDMHDSGKGISYSVRCVRDL